MTGSDGGFSIRQVGRLAPGFRRGVFVAGLAVAVVLGGLPAAADTPETGLDPTVTLTVTPSDNVLDGSAVSVTGTGWPAFTDGVIRLCGGTVAAPQCDTAIHSQFRTGAAPVIPTTLVTVKRYVNTGTTTFNCGVQACAIVATAGGKTSQHHLSILGAGTSIPSGSSTSAPTTAPTIPLPTSSTITFPPTTIPPPPTTTAPPPPPSTTTPPAAAGLLCDLLQALRGILGGLLAGIVDSLLILLGCPPA